VNPTGRSAPLGWAVAGESEVGALSVWLWRVPTGLTVTVDEEPWGLPEAVRRGVEADRAGEAGTPHPPWGDPVFAVRDIVFEEDRCHIHLRRRDNAPDRYAMHVAPTSPEALRVLSVAAVLETADGYRGFAEMASHTVCPGRLQGIGGGIDPRDVVDGTVDLRASLLRQLADHVGLDRRDPGVAAVEPLYVKEGGPYGSVVVVYRIRCSLSRRRLAARLAAWNRTLRTRGEIPELARLHFVGQDARSVIELLRDPRPRADDLDAMLESDLSPGGARSTRVRAGIVLRDGGRLALIQRIRAGRTYYVLPGGGVEPGESPEAAAVREAAEELGISVRLQGLMARVRFGSVDQLYYAAVQTGGRFGTGTEPDVHPTNGVYRPVWVSMSQVQKLDVRPRDLALLLCRPGRPPWPVFIQEGPPPPPA
jgi:8-oxo-dGTP diphosphatase